MDDPNANPDDSGKLVSFVNPDGSFAENWLDAKIEDEESGEEKNLFGEDIRTDQTIRNLKSIPKTLEMLRNTQKLVGKNKIAIPGPEATDDEWNVVMKALGYPDNPEGYNLQMPADIAKPDNELLDWFKTTSHKLRFLPAQALGLFAEWNELMKQRHEKLTNDFQLNLERGMNTLRSKCGAAFKERMEGAEKIIDTACDGLKRYGFNEEEIKDINERLSNDILKDPRIGAIMMVLGEMISEDRLHLGGRKLGFSLTPDEAKAQLNEIRGDLKGPYWKKDHPEHKAMVEKVDMLTKISMGQT